MDYTLPRPKPQSLDDVVPHTKFTVKQLTRMATAFRAPQVGMICSRDGAWDHKYVITSVALIGDEKELVTVGASVRLVNVLVYEIGVLNLGKFNTDYRFKPASRYNPAKHKVSFPVDTWEQLKSRGSMRLGTPIGDVADATISDRTPQVSAYDVNEAAKLFGDTAFYNLSAEARFALACQFKAGKEAQWAKQHAEWLAQKESGAVTPKLHIPKPKPKTPEAILADFLIK